MSDHHRSSSYYKDSYGSSSSKRYHSPAESSRMGLSSDYYDSSDSRSKRSRTDNYGAHTSSSTRYADYSASSSSGSGSRYKSSSSSYYDISGYKPSTSSSASSSKYLDDYKGSGSSSRSAPKSNVRRIPPPLTPPSLSSKSSSNRLQPLMKVSLSSTSSGVGSSSGKDYYGSRMRQAPPEYHHHYPYSSGSGTHSSSSYSSKVEFKRPVSYSTSKQSLSSGGYQHGTRPHSSSTAYRSSAAASATRRLVARSRESRIKGRSTLMNSRRDDDLRKRKLMSSKREHKRSRSGSRGDEKGMKIAPKDKKEEVDHHEQSSEKKQDVSMEYVNMAEGQVVVEEVAGDDEEDGDQENTQAGRTGMSEKNDSLKDDHPADDQSNRSNADEKSEGNRDDGKGATPGRGCEDKEKLPATRALLKLHCPYCDVRCISFREFTFHLRSSSHTRTMQAAVSDMKRKLTKVRQEMKEDQRKREKAEKVLLDTSSYCRVCELSFRTDPKEHEANEIHNKIKALIYRRCDVCDIDFRIWKVHIYHMAALEHAKRVAMKELQEGEAKGDNVKGTNLSPDELGLDLVVIRTVFYCNACARYMPIKGEVEEAKKNHCMTLNHLKSVEEFNERERRRAQREEARERAKRRRQEETEKEEKGKGANTSTELDKSAGEVEIENGNALDKNAGSNEVVGVAIKKEPIDNCIDGEDKTESIAGNPLQHETEGTKDTGGENLSNKGQENNQNEAEEDDDDEIELHAGEDDVEDESEDTGGWSRRTRSSQRGDGSSN